MPPKFVPRQRKRKVLDRERAAHKQQVGDEAQDGEAVAGGSNETAKLKAQLRSRGGTVSGKKAKRLEKYIEQKLKKDENRALLAQLAAHKIDTSLFSSSRSIGHTKQTKRQALSQALREERAGLPLGEAAREELLYERRTEPELEDGDSEDEASTSEDADRLTAEAPKPPVAASISGTVGSTAIAAGSGLKRPLEVDDDGRPVLQKRQKRGGVKSKIVIAQPPVQESEDEDDEDEWGGFSTDNDSSKGSDDESIAGDQDEDLEQEGSESGSAEESQEGADDGSDDDHDGDSSDDDSDEESDAGSDGGDGNNLEERRSAFKAWARAQRNEALGYKPAEPGSSVLEIPRPENFKPRPMEQDPLPLELQPTKSTDRKAFSVAVVRTPEIQEARLKLPVVAEEQRIMEAIHNNDIVVICGATGSGKTTQVPQFLFEAGYGCPDSPTPGMIGITQPRRVAAVSMSNRVAQELGDHSQAVGYQIRFEGTVKAGTAVKFMTDGVLLREIAQDLSLRKYSAIIVDEAHERSVNTDILIGMLSRIIKLRVEMAQEDPAVKPLKLIIMSATLRIEELTENPNLFPAPPPVLEVEGRQFPVTTHFARRTHHDYIEEAFNKISRGHKKLPPGGMLVFLTGQNEIAQLSKRLKLAFNGVNSVTGPQVRISTQEAPMEAEDVDFGDVDDTKPDDFVDEDEEADQGEDNEEEFKVEDGESGTGPTRMHVLPLYSLLPTKEQMRVFEPPPEGSRLVILATNVAETSLTIPGIRYVFDCGRSKERKYDQLTGVQSFEVGWISKASASQRAGRAGRTGPGHCYRLYSSAVYERDFPEFALPELLRTSLEGVVLQLKAMNLQHVVNFPFPTPPDRHSLVKAERLLAYLSAVSSEGRVTQVGHTMSIFPLSPRFSRILLVGHQHDCLPYTIALVAALSAAEIFIPESQAIPAAAAQEEGVVRTNEDVQAENRQANVRRAFNAVHKNFCSLDDKSDAIKMLQVLGEFAHEPTEQWCESHFVRFKVLKEAQKLRQQIVQLLKTNIPAFANITFQDKLDAPSAKQVKALKQMVAAGFTDRVAIRADKAPNPPELWRKPRRAIDVPYIPLSPLAVDGKPASDEEKLVYIHPESPLAHLSRDECPDYIVYSYLQKATSSPGDEEGGKKAKTRMHSLTDISGGVLAALAKGTPLVSYGKPVKVVSDDGKSRECWVVPYLRAEGTGGMGWPLPMQKVKQRKTAGSWVVE